MEPVLRNGNDQATILQGGFLVKGVAQRLGQKHKPALLGQAQEHTF